MIATIGKTFTFDASHKLPNHDGKCAREHGHTYSVTFELRGPINEQHGASDQGMVADYGELKRIWKAYIEPALDHQNLNETIGGECWPTTAENIAAWLLGRIQQLRPPDVDWTVSAVTVRETPGTFARVEA